MPGRAGLATIGSMDALIAFLGSFAAIVLIMAIQTMMSRLLAAAMLGEGADLVHIAMTSVLPQALVTLVLAIVGVEVVRRTALREAQPLSS